MILKEKIEKDLAEAIKSRKEREISVLRLLKDAIFLKEKEKDIKSLLRKRE